MVKLALNICVASIAMYICGMAAGWASTSFDFELPNQTYSSTIILLANSIFYLPVCLGAFVAGQAMDRMARTKIIGFCLIPLFALGWTFIALGLKPGNVYLLCSGRLILGFTMGSVFVVVMGYVFEISTQFNRAKKVAYSYFVFVCGMAMPSCLSVFSVSLLWQSYLALFLTIAQAGILLIFGIAESPDFLIRENRDNEAIEALKKLREADEDVPSELEDRIQLSGSQMANPPFSSVFEYHFKKPVIAALFLMMCHELCGINFLLLTNTIFSTPGERIVCNSIIYAFHVVATLGSVMYLLDRIKRHRLIAFSSALMCIGFSVLAAFKYLQLTEDFFLILPVLTCVVGYSFGWAAVPWVLINEIVPDNIKGQAIGLILSPSLMSLIVINPILFAMPPAVSAAVFTVSNFIIALLTCTSRFVPDTFGKDENSIRKIFQSDINIV